MVPGFAAVSLPLVSDRKNALRSILFFIPENRGVRERARARDRERETGSTGTAERAPLWLMLVPVRDGCIMYYASGGDVFCVCVFLNVSRRCSSLSCGSFSIR